MTVAQKAVSTKELEREEERPWLLSTPPVSTSLDLDAPLQTPQCHVDKPVLWGLLPSLASLAWVWTRCFSS